MSGTADERLIVMLEARISEFEKRMGQAERRGTRTYQGLQRNSRTATRAMEQDMVRSTGRINQALASTSARIGTFGRAFVGGLAAGAAATAIGMVTTNLRQTVSAIAAVGDEARRAGLAVEEFQQWGYVAEQNRIPIDALTDGFKELNLRADEWIVTGAGPAAEAFARLGFSAEDLRRRLEDPSELMLEIFRRMQNLDRAAQIRVFDEILGGTGGERFVELLAQGEGQLRRTMQRAREVGAVMDRDMIQRAGILHQKFQELTLSVQRFFQAAAVGLFAGGVETPADTLERLFGTLERARAIMGDEWFDVVISQAGELADEVEGTADALARLSDQFDADASRLTRDLADVTGQLADLGRVDDLLAFDGIVAEIDMLIARLRAGEIGAGEFETSMSEALDRTIEAMRALDEIDGVDLSDAIGRVLGLRDALALARSEAEGLRNNMPGEVGMTTGTPLEHAIMPQDMLTRGSSPPPRAPNEGTSAYGGTGSRSGGGSGSREGYAAAVADIRERTEALNMEAAALVSAAESGTRYGDAVEYARQRAELMLEAQREGREITPALQAEIDALAEAYVTAGDSAEQAAERMQRVREATEDGASFFSDFFDQFSRGGDAAASALDRLRDRLRQMAFDRIFQSLAGMGGGFGTFFSMIGMGLGGKFDQGGYTGDGGTHEPKGIVHGGEYVFSKRAVQAIGVARLERMHRAAKGYASGGYVGNAPRDRSGGMTVNVINNTGQPVEKSERTSANGDREIDLAIGRSLGRGRQDKVMSRFGVKQKVLSR